MASLLEDFDHRVRKIETATTLNEIQDIYISSKRTKITQPGSSEKLIRVEKTEEHQEDEQIPQEVPQEALSKNEKFRQELMAIQKKNLVDKDRERRSLIETCSYDFTKQMVTFTWRSLKDDWGIATTHIFYQKHKIENFETSSDANVKTLKFKISDFERHPFEKQFRIRIKYAFFDELTITYETEYLFDIPCFRSRTPLKFDQLERYYPNETISKILNGEFRAHPSFTFREVNVLNQLNKYRRMTSTEQFKSGEDRMLMLKYALDLECLSMDIGMQAFEMNCARVQKAGHSYRIKMNSALKFPDSYRDLTLCLIPIKPSQNNVPREEIYVSLERVEMGYIRFPKIMDLRTDLNYKVKFLSNKVTTRTAQNALELVSAHGLKNYFTTFDVNVGVPEKVNQVLELREAFEWENANIGMNLEQMTAVANIVNCVAYPSPYICHGPPGTGKTATLVEAVLQILKMRKDVHILISAQSNSACDEVGVRLLKYLPKSKVLRFFSPSIDPRLIDPDLKSTSNFRSGKNEYPSTEEFHFFRVVISTLVTAGRFVQMGIKPNHFDFVFIDECAAAIEPECLIAIAGLVTEMQKVHANLIFLGDHKQLGPIIESKEASKLGLSESLMERMMKLPKYSKNPEYDRKYITQLVDNFRSHPAILYFPNVQFYDGNLRARADVKEISFALNWKLLPNRTFPIILHSVVADCHQEKNGFSFYNEAEVGIVKFYVEELLENGINNQKVEIDDIGIVSPYKSQRDLLGRALKKYTGIEIGTAEYYQGREKKIIIISTVRSGYSVGFLKDERRFNVALTRAKCLEILVCDPFTLNKDPMWNSFIEYCNQNKCVVGDIGDLENLIYQPGFKEVFVKSLD